MRLTGSFARRRLMVTTSVDAPLHMGGHAIKDARIEGGSATGLHGRCWPDGMFHRFLLAWPRAVATG